MFTEGCIFDEMEEEASRTKSIFCASSGLANKLYLLNAGAKLFLSGWKYTVVIRYSSKARVLQRQTKMYSKIFLYAYCL